jgi:hypothetical protein
MTIGIEYLQSDATYILLGIISFSNCDLSSNYKGSNKNKCT